MSVLGRPSNQPERNLMTQTLTYTNLTSAPVTNVNQVVGVGSTGSPFHTGVFRKIKC